MNNIEKVVFGDYLKNHKIKKYKISKSWELLGNKMSYNKGDER